MSTIAETISSNNSPMGFFSRLIAVYFEPSKGFEDLSRKPQWFAIVCLIAFLSATLTTALTLRFDQETYVRKAIEQSPWSKKMSEEQKQRAIAQALSNSSPTQRYVWIVSAPIITLAVYVTLAGIFLLLIMLMGADINFKQSLAATAWALGPPSMILTLLAIVLVLVKDPKDVDIINPMNNVVSNLGVMVSEKTNPLLSMGLSAIDIFSFWTIFLLAAAFSKMTGEKLSKRKAAGSIILLWAIYVTGKIGITVLFSS